jgi:hypothetical protein
MQNLFCHFRKREIKEIRVSEEVFNSMDGLELRLGRFRNWGEDD